MLQRHCALLLVWLVCAPLFASDAPAPTPDLSAADQLYRSGKFADAADKYQTILKADPTLIAAQAGLIRSWLRQDKIDDAFAAATTDLAAHPNSAPLLAEMGDVQFRRARMGEAETAYRDALKADPKQVRALLGLARLYRSFSLYRQAYNLLVFAHQIVPNDPEVQRRWFAQLSRKERIAAMEAYLASPHPDDAEATEDMRHYLEFLKATADKPVHACKLVNRVEQTETRLENLFHDPKTVIGVGMVVKVNDHKERLQLDTGASGIMIGRKAAEKAGVTKISATSYGGVGDKGPQSGYLAVADHIKIGELEFQDCIVDVSDRRSIVDEDGLIGADVFSSYLIEIDLPNQKMKLSQLPKRPNEGEAPASLDTKSEAEKLSDDEEEGAEPTEKSSADAAPASPAGKATRALPQDRYIAPEMENWSKVFRFGHMLLIPTSVDHSAPMLFAIDTGAQTNALSQRAARQVTKMSVDNYTTVHGLNGQVKNVYRADNANLAFGHVAQRNQSMLTWDLSRICHDVGTEVSGMIGYQTLSLLEIKIDYRDGLVDFIYDAKRFGEGRKF